jgi:hypothetical protein
MLPSISGYDGWKNDYDGDEEEEQGDPDFYWDGDER